MVEDIAPLAAVVKKTPILEKSQMLGGHMAGDGAQIGQLPDRTFLLQQDMNYPQPAGMGDSP